MEEELAKHISDNYEFAALETLDAHPQLNVNAIIDGESLLGKAVDKYMIKLVNALMVRGANPNLQSGTGETPLMILLHRGYSDDDIALRGFIQERELTRHLPIHENSNNNTSVPNAKKNKVKLPPTRFDTLFQILMPRTNLNLQNHNGETALMIAVKKSLDMLGNTKKTRQREDSIIRQPQEFSLELEIEDMLEAGARVDIVTKSGDTVFHILCENSADSAPYIVQLLASKATTDIINMRNKYGYTALDNAIGISDSYRTAEHLLYKGAKLTPTVIDIVKDMNYGPLMEVVEHLLHHEEILPAMRLPEDLEVLFGVELEICAKLTPECAEERMSPEIFQEKSWNELFALFAKNVLEKSHMAAKMRERYEYMYVSGGGKYGADLILNLSTFLLEPMPSRKKVSYDKPFFTIDSSVVCADYKVKKGQKNRRPEFMPAIEETFHFELVSPILTDIAELRELLEFVGLGARPQCFIANNSAGFHVNASLRNRLTQKPIPLTSDFFTRTFFPRYSVWEAKVYPQVRNEGKSNYAQKIGDTDPEEFPELYHDILESKYVSLHRKHPRELVEFRLFGSIADLPTLLRYTNMATGFLRETYTEWYRFYKPSLRDTNAQIRAKQIQLRKSLHTIQARLRTRRTKGLLQAKADAEANLRTLATLREKNARTRRTVLQSMGTRATKRTSKGKGTKSAKGAKSAKQAKGSTTRRN